MTIKIDKGIEPPPYNGKTKYPFRTMEVGDSFFVPESEATRDAVASSASWTLARHGIKTSVRTVTEDGVKGVRVWRIADEPKLRAVK